MRLPLGMRGWRLGEIPGYGNTMYVYHAMRRSHDWLSNRQRNPPVPPTVHIFASPPTDSDVLSPPHVLLLPLQANTSAEPALLLVSPNGRFRFWSSIFLGLAGADRFVEERIPLFEPKPPRDKETITTAQVIIPSLSLASVNSSLRSASIVSGTTNPNNILQVSLTQK